MTQANCLRLYEHYVNTKQKENAEEMRKRLLNKYKIDVNTSQVEVSEVSSDGKKPKR